MNRFGVLALIAVAYASAYAEKTCNVTAYGAKGDGQTKDTVAIQKAIDDCAGSNGTVVLEGKPKFITAPLILKSHMTLRVSKGTTLEASSDHADFPEKEEFKDHGRQAMLTSVNAEDITITGGGVVDGKGQSWWTTPGQPRPRLLVFDHSRHIHVEDITVQNSPMWQIVPYYSHDLVFRNMKILAPAREGHNTDGIDPFASTDIVIEHVYIDTGDDNIAIKSGQPGSPGPDEPSRNITITDCEFMHGHGLSIGSEIAGGVQNVRAERIHFKGTDQGIRVKSNRDRGNDIGNFIFRDITMEDVKTAILLSEFYPKIPEVITSEPVTRLTPHFHDIHIENVKAVGSQTAAIVVGLPESPIRNLTLTNVHLSAKKGASFQYVDVQAKDFTVKAETGESIHIGTGVTGNLK